MSEGVIRAFLESHGAGEETLRVASKTAFFLRNIDTDRLEKEVALSEKLRANKCAFPKLEKMFMARENDMRLVLFFAKEFRRYSLTSKQIEDEIPGLVREFVEHKRRAI